MSKEDPGESDVTSSRAAVVGDKLLSEQFPVENTKKIKQHVVRTFLNVILAPIINKYGWLSV